MGRIRTIEMNLQISHPRRTQDGCSEELKEWFYEFHEKNFVTAIRQRLIDSPHPQEKY